MTGMKLWYHLLCHITKRFGSHWFAISRLMLGRTLQRFLSSSLSWDWEWKGWDANSITSLLALWFGHITVSVWDSFFSSFSWAGRIRIASNIASGCSILCFYLGLFTRYSVIQRIHHAMPSQHLIFSRPLPSPHYLVSKLVVSRFIPAMNPSDIPFCCLSPAWTKHIRIFECGS